MNRFDPLKGMTLLDLSAPLAEALPGTWPGHLPFAHRVWRDFGPLSIYKTHFLVMDEHCGTHFDAPPHFVPPEGSGLPLAGPLGGKGGDQVDLARLCGPAAVVDLRDLAGQGGPGVSPWITAARLQAWEAEHGAFRAGDIVLLATGWSGHYRSGAAGRAYLHTPVVERSTPGWPAPDVAAIRLLADRGVTTVGADTPSMGAAHDGAPVHQEALGRGMLFIEGLCGLAALPPIGAYFMFLPLKLADSTGCPGRAVALLPETP
jgi:kynurenine formamidase